LGVRLFDFVSIMGTRTITHANVQAGCLSGFLQPANQPALPAAARHRFGGLSVLRRPALSWSCLPTKQIAAQ
jgi:hypothetical protein